MTLIELKNYVLTPEKNGHGISPCHLCIGKGDIVSIQSDSANDAHLLFKGLATLSYPQKGTYVFQGRALDFSDYRNLLKTKKNIGYLTSSTTLISNRSIRDNLSLGNVYFGNDLSVKLDQETLDLCRDFGIEALLDERPVNLGLADNKRAMFIRELIKKPRVMLFENPEDFSGLIYKSTLIRVLKEEIKAGMALVFLTYDEDFMNAFPGIILEIKKGGVSFVSDSQTHSG
ncbi:MAG: ATP-binding cassette domain-containing protein [Proteobacteria bacterium]|nr:ATP-binding cassette domain-containing protein [Pseudomonadota bacterium]